MSFKVNMDINYLTCKAATWISNRNNNILYKTLYSAFGAFYIKNDLHVNKMGKYWSILWKSTSFKCLCLWSCNDFMSDSASLSLDLVRWFRYENLHNKLLDSWAMTTSISHNQNNKKKYINFDDWSLFYLSGWSLTS